MFWRQAIVGQQDSCAVDAIWSNSCGVLDKFSFLTKVANFKQNRTVSQSLLTPIWSRQDSCARCFGQVLACYLRTSLSFSTKANFKQNERCAVCFDANFGPTFQAKRQFRRVFWRQFEETGKVRTVFWTSLRFSTKVANFKQNVSCAHCFDAYLKQLDSCARCFGQVSAS